MQCSHAWLYKAAAAHESFESARSAFGWCFRTGETCLTKPKRHWMLMLRAAANTALYFVWCFNPNPASASVPPGPLSDDSRRTQKYAPTGVVFQISIPQAQILYIEYRRMFWSGSFKSDCGLIYRLLWLNFAAGKNAVSHAGSPQFIWHIQCITLFSVCQHLIIWINLLSFAEFGRKPSFCACVVHFSVLRLFFHV